jgi:type IV secretory pathway VirJ component
MKVSFLPVLIFSLLGFLFGNGDIPDNIRPDDQQELNIADLPINITKGKGDSGNNIIAVLFSGDGGWFGFEQSVADHLAGFGVSTIGIDTRKYFWNRRTPEKTATDITNLLNHYRVEWGASRYVIAGYSQGAEIVPFVITRLPEEIRSGIISGVMLSPESTTDFEVHFSNMLGLGNRHNTYDVTGEISRIKNIHLVCIFGQDEKTSVPDILKNDDVVIKFVPGNHHYKSNAALIVETMRDAKAF